MELPCVHPDLHGVMGSLHRREAMRRAEAWRLLRQAGLQRRGWLPRPGCWLLCQLGRLLVRAGRRLQEFGSSPQPAFKAGR
jgi:hypothetical protein